MSDNDTIELKSTKLDALIRACSGKIPDVRVGIMGSKNSRSGGKETNASIGAKHEFGMEGMPRRSFLRMPLTEYLQRYLDRSKKFDPDTLEKVIEKKNIEPWLTQLGFVAESVVREAFATGGFGKWQPWKTPGYTNNTGQILVDTRQLRKSITSEVE